MKTWLLNICTVLAAVVFGYGQQQSAASNNRYFVVRRPGGMTWDEANEACQQTPGSRLALIKSDADQLAAASLIAYKDDYFWMGLRKVPRQTLGIFTWVDGSIYKTGDYNAFAPGEPNNWGGVEHCVEMDYQIGGKWNDLNCDLRQFDGGTCGAICERFTCEQNAGFQTKASPSFVDAKGQTPIKIKGACFDAKRAHICTFYDSAKVPVSTIATVTKAHPPDAVITCTPPFLYGGGRMKLGVTIADNSSLLADFPMIGDPDEWLAKRTNNGTSTSIVNSWSYVTVGLDKAKVDVQLVSRDDEFATYNLTWDPKTFHQMVANNVDKVDIKMLWYNLTDDRWQTYGLLPEVNNTGFQQIRVPLVGMPEEVQKSFYTFKISPFVNWTEILDAVQEYANSTNMTLPIPLPTIPRPLSKTSLNPTLITNSPTFETFETTEWETTLFEANETTTASQLTSIPATKAKTTKEKTTPATPVTPASKKTDKPPVTKPTDKPHPGEDTKTHPPPVTPRPDEPTSSTTNGPPIIITTSTRPPIDNAYHDAMDVLDKIVQVCNELWWVPVPLLQTGCKIAQAGQIAGELAPLLGKSASKQLCRDYLEENKVTPRKSLPCLALTLFQALKDDRFHELYDEAMEDWKDYRHFASAAMDPDDYIAKGHYSPNTGKLVYGESVKFKGGFSLKPTKGSVANSLYQTVKDNALAHAYCCLHDVFSNRSQECDEYNRRRQQMPCFQSPFNGWGAGDPHFTTLDGFYYTFNGAGEFWVMQTSTNESYLMFSIQGRMQPWSRVAAFNAFAIQAGPSASVVQLEFSEAGGKVMDVLVDGYPLDFDDPRLQTQYFPGAVVTAKSNDLSTVTVALSADIAFTITASPPFMAIHVTAGISHQGKTMGLMGNFDGDPNNDLTSPTGNVLRPDAGDSQIHYGFGMLWNVSKADSLFTYRNGKKYEDYWQPNYTPAFYKPNPSPAAEKVCGKSVACLYDYQLSNNDAKVAANTKKVEDTANETQIVLNERTPMCPGISRLEHGYLTAAEGFFVNSTVTFGCFDEFWLNGSSVAACLPTEIWDPAIPECRSIYCPNISNLEHGTIVNQTNGTKIGSEVSFSCDPGYYINGSVAILCQVDNSWNDTEPKCAKSSCPPLPEEIYNGSLTTSDGYLFESVARFFCDEGFDLRGWRELTCLANGSWDHDVPQCHKSSCPPLRGAIDQGSVEISDGFLFGSVATYSCDVGYQLIGFNKLTCQSNKTWDRDEPKCRIKVCPSVTSPKNGRFQPSDHFNYGSKLSFYCSEGYRLNGSSSATCLANSTWSDDISPTCDRIICRALSAPLNASLVSLSNGYYYGSTAHFTCEPEFVLIGSAVLSCTSVGIWDAAEPKCRLKTCADFASLADPFSSGKVEIKTSPSSVELKGHSKLSIEGICFDKTMTHICKFHDLAKGEIIVPANFESTNGFPSVECLVPYLYTLGRSRLELKIVDGKKNRTASYSTLVAVVQDSPSITVTSATIGNGTLYKLSWDPRQTFPKDKLLDVILVAFNLTNELWQDYGKVSCVMNDGYHEVFVDVAKLQFDIATSFFTFKLQPSSCSSTNMTSSLEVIGDGESLLDTIAKFAEELLFKIADELCDYACDLWLGKNTAPVSGGPPCPPLRSQAESDKRFTSISSGDFQSVATDEAGVGTLVSYDSSDRAVRAFSTRSLWGTIPAHAIHFLEHVLIPQAHCCRKGPTSPRCQTFNEKIPQKTCNDYEPPITGSGSGDPHFTTFDGLYYTFNGQGEFTVIKTTNVPKFLLQGRMQPVQNGKAARFTAFAMQAGTNGSIVQVQIGSDPNGLEVFVDGTRLSFETPLLLVQYFPGVVVSAKNSEASEVSVAFSSDIAFTFSAVYGYLNYASFVGSSFRQRMTGLMGNYDGSAFNDLTTPTGQVVASNSTTEQIHYNFGLRWRIRKEESLFTYFDGKSYEDYQNPYFTPNFAAYDPQTAPEYVRAVCGDSPACTFDYQVTGDPAVANGTKTFERFMNSTITALDQKAVMCPSPPRVENGFILSPNSSYVGSVITFGCFDEFWLNGSSTATCQPDGSWSIARTPECRSVHCPELVTSPSMSISATNETFIGSVVTFACKNDNFEMSGSPVLLCQPDSSWNGTIPICIERKTSTIEMVQSTLAPLPDSTAGFTTPGSSSVVSTTLRSTPSTDAPSSNNPASTGYVTTSSNSPPPTTEEIVVPPSTLAPISSSSSDTLTTDYGTTSAPPSPDAKNYDILMIIYSSAVAALAILLIISLIIMQRRNGATKAGNYQSKANLSQSQPALKEIQQTEF